MAPVTKESVFSSMFSVYAYTCDNKLSFSQSWKSIIEETSNVAKQITENVNQLCSKTLEKLLQLTQEMKSNRKSYVDERQRLDVEFAKVCRSGQVT